MKKKDVLKELTRGVHMPSFCDEEGRCEALEEGEYVDAKECSWCKINHIVKAFNRGIEFQKQKSPWISVENDLPCNHEELISSDDKRHTNYVVAIIQGYIILSIMYKLDGKWQWKNDEPTYWMPIPEPPKE